MDGETDCQAVLKIGEREGGAYSTGPTGLFSSI
jgi:hypothetical protein